MKSIEESNLIYLILIIIFGIFSLGSVYFHYIKDEEMGKLRREFNYYNSTYISRQGGTSLLNGTMINYDLRSFDGGKIWYACERGNNGELIILGEAETVYPGLMKTLQAWDKIKEYVEKNGPINPNDLTPEFEKTLNDAKITIKRK